MTICLVIILSFSYHICVVDCWPVCLNLLYQNLLILKLVSGCVSTFSYVFSCSIDLWKVVARVTVGCSDLYVLIDCFYWSKISFKLFVQYLFILLNFVYHIYWINVNFSWNLFSVVSENCQWDVSKPDIWNFFPCRFVEGCGEGASFYISHVVINKLIGFKDFPKLFYFLVFYVCVGQRCNKAHWVNYLIMLCVTY